MAERAPRSKDLELADALRQNGVLIVMGGDFSYFWGARPSLQTAKQIMVDAPVLAGKFRCSAEHYHHDLQP